jgi:hypothetical protein
MKLEGNPLRFGLLYRRWRNINILILGVYLVLFALTELTNVLNKDKFGIIYMSIAAVFVIYRFYIMQLLREFKRINHIIRIVSCSHELIIETFSVSILFGLITKKSIVLKMLIEEVGIERTNDNWPLLKRTLKSENNFMIIFGGQQYFLVRNLFEDSDQFENLTIELTNGIK